MNKIIINSTEFNMYSYFQTGVGLNVIIADTTFTEIETAVGDSARIEIGEDCIGYNLTLSSCVRDNGMINVTFIDQDKTDVLNILANTVNDLQGVTIQNTGDIEANAEAIVELAELIGGAE